MAKAGRVHHWKHGWIPLDAEAKAIVAARGKKDVPDGPNMPALNVKARSELSPGLQKKINTKLETLTGLKEPELAAKVQANLVDLWQNNDHSEADWYSTQGKALAGRAAAVEHDFPGFKLSQEQFTGMVAVTSAKKRWKENVAFADGIARKLAADQAFSVDQHTIDDYNAWAIKRDGLAKPHLDLKPGTYRPSELPSDFAASKTPGMPKHMNTDYVIRAVQIANGDVALDETIGGPKQRSFVNNLLDPADKRFATVDTWHYRAAMKGIPVTYTVGPKGHQKTYTYTLEQWTDRDLSVKDGRAKLYGYDGRRDRYDPKNVAATKKAADAMAPQTFFQSGPSSVADHWKSGNGTYPWFVQQTQAAADQVGATPNELQAVAWYAVGGGA